MKTHSISKKLFAVLLSIMMMLSVFAPAASALSVDSSLLPEGFRITEEKNYMVIGGVSEKHFTINNKAGNNQIRSYALEINLNNPDLSIVAGYNDGDTDGYGRATVLNQAAALEKKRNVNVVGGINADFFNKDNGAPVGLLVMDSVVGHDASYEPFFGITKDGKPVIRKAYSSYSDIKEAVGGNVILVKDGKILTNDTSYLAPRSAVGIKADGSVVLFTCDGRQAPESCGMDNYQVAATMLSLGCVDALSLDGGGSSTLVSKREAGSNLTTKNKPCYKVDRPVSTSLFVCSTAKPTGIFDHVSFDSETYDCALNSSVTLRVYGVDTNGYKVAMPEGGKLVVSDGKYGRLMGNNFMARGVEGEVTINYVIGDEIVGTAVVRVDKNADTALDRFIKNIIQQFLDMIQLFKFAMGKIKDSGGKLPQF